MDRQNPYFKQVELLVRALPAVGESSCFALKGGTAINLFYRDMPRLSVDIDLVYIPIKERDESLREMSAELKEIAYRITRMIPNSRIQYSKIHQSEYVTRLLIEVDRAVIKIEVSPVLRGTFAKPEVKRIKQTAEDIFGFAEIPVVSFEDLYAGKILAALDRQHPRDLFDVKGLLENEGFTHRLKEAFIVYLISHNRRFQEILNPAPLDIEHLFRTDFTGMTTISVSMEALTKTRTELIEIMVNNLADRDKKFLLGFKEGKPDWDYFSASHIKELPAVKWKLHNLNKLPLIERQGMLEALKDFFGM